MRNFIGKILARMACWFTGHDLIQTGNVAESEPHSSMYGRVFGEVYHCRRCDKAALRISAGNKLAGKCWELL